MNYNKNNITSPPRRILSENQRESIISSPSITSSTFNNFQVGLIKVYQSDEECSMDSFSINSRKFSDVNNIISQVDANTGQDNTFTQSGSRSNQSYTITPAFQDSVLFQSWEQLPQAQRDNLVIPEKGIERPQYVLDKIVESYQSEKGTFLTSDIFLNRKLYQQPETILNGSVKINIIQEISSMLRKFDVDNSDPSKFSTLEPTLTYYKKLMDAFDVFQIESQNASFDSDSISTNSSIMTSRPYKTHSREIFQIPSTPTSLNNKQLPPVPEPERERPKKRNSLILDKFRGKIKAKPKRHSLNPDTHATSAHGANGLGGEKSRTNLHSRSISVSSTASSRSVKDQATVHEYIKAIENLQFTLNTISRNISESAGNVEPFNMVVDFLTEYIVKFIITDITYLVMRFLKNSASELT